MAWRNIDIDQLLITDLLIRGRDDHDLWRHREVSSERMPADTDPSGHPAQTVRHPNPLTAVLRLRVHERAAGSDPMPMRSGMEAGSALQEDLSVHTVVTRDGSYVLPCDTCSWWLGPYYKPLLP
jgi:hypothetical protein